MEYRVIALSVGGSNNKIFDSGDIVKTENFKEGRAEELVKLGFLEPFIDEEQELKRQIEAEEKAKKEKGKK